MTIREIQNEIIKLKKEKDFLILAHTYQTHDILEIADYTGDSFGLSRQAMSASQKNVLMCGVRFMAETAKILSPEKNVFLSHADAGCPMAEQFSLTELRRIKEKHSDCAVVAYINTTSELKTECDLCVTSSSALDAVKKLPNKNILFIPDCNLGAWVAEQIPEKNFYFIKGGCPVHMKITVDDVLIAREKHPDSLLLVHPECLKEVTENADYVGSTTGIMDFAEKSAHSRFIIGTENSVVQHLRFAFPEKEFFELSKNCVCNDMRLTTLADILNCLKGKGGEKIALPDETMKKARICIDKMLEI